jgi:hypothetical protein
MQNITKGQPSKNNTASNNEMEQQCTVDSVDSVLMEWPLQEQSTPLTPKYKSKWWLRRSRQRNDGD